MPRVLMMLCLAMGLGRSCAVALAAPSTAIGQDGYVCCSTQKSENSYTLEWKLKAEAKSMGTKCKVVDQPKEHCKLPYAQDTLFSLLGEQLPTLPKLNLRARADQSVLHFQNTKHEMRTPEKNCCIRGKDPKNENDDGLMACIRYADAVRKELVGSEHACWEYDLIPQEEGCGSLSLNTWYSNPPPDYNVPENQCKVNFITNYFIEHNPYKKTYFLRTVWEARVQVCLSDFYWGKKECALNGRRNCLSRIKKCAITKMDEYYKGGLAEKEKNEEIMNKYYKDTFALANIEKKEEMTVRSMNQLVRWALRKLKNTLRV